MKKISKLALAATLTLGTTSAFATNGSVLIGTGAKARGMGGATIGMSHGAESGLANGALITSVEGTEISFGGTLFMPNVSVDTNLGAGATSADSAADISVIPEVSVATKITENFYAGIGMWGTAGMGVDYRDEPGLFQMVTNLQLMQFGVPLAYKMDDFSVAITPVLQYGSLDFNYAGQGPTPGASSSTQGVAQDLAFGFNLGLSYEVAGITLGAIYKSQIDMDYQGQLSQAMSDFTGISSTAFSDELSTPAEIGIGVSYKMNEHTIAIDYKQIKWEDAEGYKNFAWENQDVVSLGYEYATKGWAARAGYNYASSPITDQGTAGGLLNTLNLLGFPAIVESHLTVGGTYGINDKTTIDAAFVYGLETEETYKNMGGEDITATHSQTSLTVAVNFNF